MLLHAGKHCIPGNLPSDLVRGSPVVFFVVISYSRSHSFVIIIPAIAQRIVDTTDLPVYSAQILDPTPDSVTFTLHTSLSIPAGLRVRIDALRMTLFNRDVTPIKPYLIVPFSSYSLKGTTSISVTRNNSHIYDKQQLIIALTRAVYQERFTLSAKGSTVGHLGALDAHLSLNKDVELNGMSTWHHTAARLVADKRTKGLDKLRSFSIGVGPAAHSRGR